MHPYPDAMALRRAGTLLGSFFLLQLLAAPTCLSDDETCVYKIKVISAAVRGSQKTPNVAITFYNPHGQEAYFAAVPTRHEPECYNTDEFYKTCTPCVPEICKMRLHFDKFDADIVDTPPRVFLTSVEVANSLMGEGKRRFDINGWLAIDEPPFLDDRTFDLCSWMSMHRTIVGPDATTTTTMTTSGTTECTTNSTIDGSTTITSSFCSTTMTMEL